MARLKQWFSEHLVEDMLRATHRPNNCVFSVTEDDNLQHCMDSFVERQVKSLLYCRKDAPISWLLISDLLNSMVIFNDEEYEYVERDRSCKLKDLQIAYRPVNIVMKTDSLAKIINHSESFTNPLLISNEKGEFEGVITASDFLHYLIVYGDQLDSLVQQPAENLKCDTEPMLLGMRHTALDCLRMLLQEDSAGILGLVDTKGGLIGNVTLSAFLPLPTDLDIPILRYFQEEGRQMGFTSFVSDTNFWQILRKVTNHHVQHIWKLDHLCLPMGVVRVQHMVAFICEIARFSNHSMHRHSFSSP